MNSGAGGFQTLKTILLSAAAVLLLAVSGVIDRTDRWWFDSLQALGAANAPLPDDSALVLIDEHSLSAMSEGPLAMRWPWPRAAFAALLAGLHAAGAERIAVDFIFLENSAAAEQDMLLGAVAAGLPGVSLATVPGRMPVVWPNALQQEYPRLFDQRSKWGFVNSTPDADSIIRTYHPPGSLAEAMLDPADADLPRAPERIHLRWRGNLEQLRGRGVTMLSAAPFVAAGWGILDQATQASPDLDPIGLARAINQARSLTGEAFEPVMGKTVFVGANAAGTFDTIATPLGAPEPGVILQWNAFANLQQRDYVQVLPAPLTWALALLVVIILPWPGRDEVRLRKPALVSFVLLAIIVATSIGAFFTGAWLAPGLPVSAVAVAFTLVTVESLRLERVRKQEIQGWFGAYVSPAVVDRLVKDPNAIELGGELREVTVMFSDIEGFTTISEKLPPAELVTLINRFLETQTERIIDRGGYLDKYIGDAIMAVFGSPEPLQNHALEACHAALACRAALEKLNDELDREAGIRLGMRTGINTGDVVVGNVGSTRKRNYTVLGDAVNLASRLEGANKQTGTLILLGPLTAEYAKGSMLLRPVARLQVKGKTQAVEVSELLGEREVCDEESIRFAEVFTRAFGAYCQQDFTSAATLFRNALEMRPTDGLGEHYLEQAQLFMTSPPGPDWQGILKLETK